MVCWRWWYLVCLKWKLYICGWQEKCDLVFLLRNAHSSSECHRFLFPFSGHIQIIFMGNGHNDVGDEGQRDLIPYDSQNKLMKRRVHALANKTIEKITGSKQLTRYIHILCTYFWWVSAICGVAAAATAHEGEYTRKTRSQLSILQLIVDNWTTPWHTSSIVCYLLLGCLAPALVRANSRNSCDISRTLLATKDNLSRTMWIFRWVGAWVSVFEKGRHLPLSNHDQFPATESV